MSEHIQPLLDRIRTEGLKKAEEEREALLEQARVDADRIRADAEAEAEKIRAQGERDAEASEERGAAALEQAARDTLLRFRSELNRQLEEAAKAAAGRAMSGDALVKELLKELIGARGSSGKVVVEAGSETAKRLERLLPALLKDVGSTGEAEVVLNPRGGAGLKLRFEGETAVVDLTDEAIADWLGAYVRPELAKLLRACEES